MEVLTGRSTLPQLQSQEQPKLARASTSGRGKDKKKRKKRLGQEPITNDEKNRRKRLRRKEKKEEKKQLEAEDAARTHQGMRTLLQHMAGPAGSARSEATFEHEEQDEVSNSNDDSQGGLMQDAAHRTQAPAALSHRMGIEELAQAARDAAALPEDEGVCACAC